MEFASHDTIEIDGIIIGPGMTQEQAETLYARGKDVAVFVMMVLAKKLAVETATSTDAPSTPSSGGGAAASAIMAGDRFSEWSQPGMARLESTMNDNMARTGIAVRWALMDVHHRVHPWAVI